MINLRRHQAATGDWRIPRMALSFTAANAAMPITRQVGMDMHAAGTYRDSRTLRESQCVKTWAFRRGESVPRVCERYPSLTASARMFGPLIIILRFLVCCRYLWRSNQHSSSTSLHSNFELTAYTPQRRHNITERFAVARRPLPHPFT